MHAPKKFCVTVSLPSPNFVVYFLVSSHQVLGVYGGLLSSGRWPTGSDPFVSDNVSTFGAASSTCAMQTTAALLAEYVTRPPDSFEYFVLLESLNL